MDRHTTTVESVEALLKLPYAYELPQELVEEGVELMIPCPLLIDWVEANQVAFEANRMERPPETDEEREHDAVLWARLCRLQEWARKNPNVQTLLAVQLMPEFEEVDGER